MPVEAPKRMQVAVLLEHHFGENWSAMVPLIKGCLAEGETAEAATQAILPEIEDFLKRYPQLRAAVAKQPEFLLTEVDVDLEEPEAAGGDAQPV